MKNLIMLVALGTMLGLGIIALAAVIDSHEQVDCTGSRCFFGAPRVVGHECMCVERPQLVEAALVKEFAASPDGSADEHFGHIDVFYKGSHKIEAEITGCCLSGLRVDGRRISMESRVGHAMQEWLAGEKLPSPTVK